MSNDETPLGGQYDPDELEELESQAERRGTGRGLVIGLLIAAAVAIAAIVFVLMTRSGSRPRRTTRFPSRPCRRRPRSPCRRRSS